MPEPSAVIGLSTVDTSGPQPVLHVRSWFIRAADAPWFAAYMTRTFGPPDELLSDAAAMERDAEQAAADGTALFLIQDEAPP